MNKTVNDIVLFIAQGAYSGRLPKAPGTAGTVIGVLLYLLLKDVSPLWYGVACVGVTVLGTWAAGYADCILGTKDSPYHRHRRDRGHSRRTVPGPLRLGIRSRGIRPVPVLRHPEALAAQETAGHARRTGCDAGRYRGGSVYKCHSAGSGIDIELISKEREKKSL